MGILSWLFSSSEAEPSQEPRPPVVDEEALPRPVRGLYSALKDFEQIFTEDKRYTAVDVFPNRESWLQNLRTILVQISADPGSADMKTMSKLWKEAAKMEKTMKERSVNIPGGASIYYVKEKMLAYASEYGLEGIALSRGSAVSDGKRVTSLKFLLMDGSEIVVLEDELRSGGGAPSEIGVEEGDSETGRSTDEEGANA